MQEEDECGFNVEICLLLISAFLLGMLVVLGLGLGRALDQAECGRPRSVFVRSVSSLDSSRFPFSVITA